jgi:hypothetical protein
MSAVHFLRSASVAKTFRTPYTTYALAMASCGRILPCVDSVFVVTCSKCMANITRRQRVSDL